MMSVDWSKLRVFLAVARAGSFTHAADVLNVSQSALSRQVAALEHSLGVSLFNRHARGLFLTEQGEKLFNAADGFSDQIARVFTSIRDSNNAISGELNITSSVDFGSTWLSYHIGKFCEQYPNLLVNLHLTNRQLDLVQRQADIAVWLRQPQVVDLVQQRITSYTHRIYGAMDYIQRNGMPRSLSDLDNHRIVAFSEQSTLPDSNLNWLLKVGREPNKVRAPFLTVNTEIAVYRAIRGGAGLGCVPEFMVPDDVSSSIVPVLSEIESPVTTVYVVYHPTLRYSLRVRAFRDFLLELSPSITRAEKPHAEDLDTVLPKHENLQLIES